MQDLDARMNWLACVFAGRWATAAYFEADLPPLDRSVIRECGESRDETIVTGEIYDA